MGIVTRLFAFGEFGRGAAAATVFYSTAAVAYHLYRWIAERKERKVQVETEDKDFGDTYDINTIEELRAVMPAGKGGSCIADALKVMDYLDECVKRMRLRLINGKYRLCWRVMSLFASHFGCAFQLGLYKY